MSAARKITVIGAGAAAAGPLLTTGALVNGAVVYEPTLTASGTDTFTYTISDGVNVATATVTITIFPGQIPATGGEHTGEQPLAAGMVIAGGALTFGSRRRRATI